MKANFQVKLYWKTLLHLWPKKIIFFPCTAYEYALWLCHLIFVIDRRKKPKCFRRIPSHDVNFPSSFQHRKIANFCTKIQFVMLRNLNELSTECDHNWMESWLDLHCHITAKVFERALLKIFTFKDSLIKRTNVKTFKLFSPNCENAVPVFWTEMSPPEGSWTHNSKDNKEEIVSETSCP